MKCKICNKKTTKAGIGSHVRRSHNITLQEYYDSYIKSHSEGICICGNSTKYNGLIKGYSIYCSECTKKEMVRKVKKTKQKRYGDSNYSNPDKVKKTKQKRYGSSTYNNRKQAHKTMTDKYGSHYASTDINKERVKQLNNQGKIGFGTDSYKQTIKSKYNVSHISQTNSNRKRMSEYAKQFGFGTDVYNDKIRTIYGVENISQHPDIRNKAEVKRRKTIYKRFFERKLFDRLNVTPQFTEYEYVTGNLEYNFKCNKCDIIYSSKILNGGIRRCPSCYGNRSSYENIIYDIITNINPNITISTNNRTILPNYEIDIYLPEYKIGIEINGLYWHSEQNLPKDYHLNKTEVAENHGIHLIHIWEDDILYKLDIIETRLCNLLGKSKKIYARNCIIKEISYNEKLNFLEQYHIQGNDSSSVRLGAFHNDKLVGVMTFGKLRISTGNTHINNNWELYRFCTINTVVGLASKMLTYFIRKYSPDTIISYADRCWAKKGNTVYDAIGFKLVNTGGINYHYVINNIREHRYKYRKSQLKSKLDNFDPNLTEHENMLNNGYYRIYGPGSLKYEFKIN